jgi:hypothetical protein
MIDTTVCAAPAGIDGSGRVRVPARVWAAHLTSDASVTGEAMRSGVRGLELKAVIAPLGTSTQPVGGSTQPFGTNVTTTLGNHSPGRPTS